MMLTTSASWIVPTGYFVSMFSHGLDSICLSPRAIFSRSMSTDSTFTSICCSFLTISVGWLMRPQLMSVMCSSPSMPPRSMNAPKSAIFFTVPVTSEPISSFLSVSAFCSSRCTSISLRREMTMFPPLLVDLEDHRVDVAADPVADLAGPADVDLAGGQEHRHADVHQQAAP